MVHDLRNLQTNYPPVLVTNITFLVLYAKNEVAAKIARVYIPISMLCVSAGPSKITDNFVLLSLCRALWRIFRAKMEKLQKINQKLSTFYFASVQHLNSTIGK